MRNTLMRLEKKIKLNDLQRKIFLFILYNFGMLLFMTVNATVYEGESVYEGWTRELFSYLVGDSAKLYVLKTDSLNLECYSFCPYMQIDSFYLRN